MTGSNPAAAKAFYDTVALRQNNWGSHNLPRASSIGNDIRQQYFSLRRDEYPPEPISGEALWGMEEGNRQEEPVYQVLREQGYMVHSIQAGAVRYLDSGGATQVRVVPDNERMADIINMLRRTGCKPFLTMHIDGIIEGGPDRIRPTLLELKKATMFSFGGMVQHGVVSDKPTYRMQATVCAGSFGLDTARFYVFTRDKSATEWYFTRMRSTNPIKANPALYVEDMQVDPRVLKMADFRALYLLEKIAAGDIPEPDPGIGPLNVRIEKDGSKSGLFPCAWCEWREPCVQEMFSRGVNINDFQVVQDLRSKAQKEKTDRG